MNYGICGLSIIPVRSEPSERSEMVTQILFGEFFEIIEYLPGWYHVKLEYDGYQGWVDSKMITLVSVKQFKKLKESHLAVTTDIFTPVPISNEQHILLVAGSSLPFWRPYLREFSVNGITYPMNGNISAGVIKEKRKLIISQALKYFNAPYLWGGRSPLGIDCSGLTQIIYKMAGVRIPRDASKQVFEGTAFSFVEEAKPGDLAFFDDEEGIITHVGIIWEQKKIIHASGKVRIDNIDQYGIFNIDTKQYTHKLRVMKKLVE